MNGGMLLGRSAIQTFPIVLGRKLNQRKAFPPADPEQEPTVFVTPPKGSDLAGILRQLDPSFEATYSLLDGISVTSFANENGWKVVSIESDDDEAETLTGEPRKTRDVKPEKIGPLLSFLMQRHASSMLLHGPGIPVRVPDAAHYAVFALVSASFWPCDHKAIAGIQGTLGQADEIMEALIASRMRRTWRRSCKPPARSALPGIRPFSWAPRGSLAATVPSSTGCADDWAACDPLALGGFEVAIKRAVDKPLVMWAPTFTMIAFAMSGLLAALGSWLAIKWLLPSLKAGRWPSPMTAHHTGLSLRKAPGSAGWQQPFW